MTPSDRTTPNFARDRIVRSAWRWFRLRGLALALVFTCGLAGFLLGADVSERPGIPDAAFAVKFYYALGLFVLGGLDLGTPVGGSAIARGMLWFAYLAAPLITVSAVIEALIRAVKKEPWWLARLRDHVVIVGADRLGMLLVDRTRQLSPNAEIVVVEARPDHPNLEAIRDVYGGRILSGEITSDAIIASLHLEHASRVALLTGDDLVNLDAAAKILAAHPRLAGHMVVHVSDLRFLHALEATRIGRDVETFNTHQIAASHLMKTTLSEYFASTTGTDSIVLAGFGRFGQSLLKEMVTDAREQVDTVIIVDVDVERRVADFDDAEGEPSGYRRIAIAGDLEDPNTWSAVLAELGDRHSMIVLGTGDDRANLRAALRNAGRLRNSTVVARTFDVSSVGTALAQEAGFQCFAVSDLVAASVPARWCRP